MTKYALKNYFLNIYLYVYRNYIDKYVLKILSLWLDWTIGCFQKFSNK